MEKTLRSAHQLTKTSHLVRLVFYSFYGDCKGGHL